MILSRCGHPDKLKIGIIKRKRNLLETGSEDKKSIRMRELICNLPSMVGV